MKLRNGLNIVVRLLVLLAVLLAVGHQGWAASKTAISLASATQNSAAKPENVTVPAVGWAGKTRSSIDVAPYAGANVISFSNGYAFDTRKGEPALPTELTYSTPKGDQSAYYIVQFRGPIRDEWVKGLENEGAEVLYYLPNYAFVVRMNEPIRARIASSKGEVSWTGLYQPAYKVSDRITERIAARGKGGTVRAALLLFSPEHTDDVVKQVEAIVGHKVWMKLETEWAPGQWNRKIFVDIAAQDLNALAQLPGVYWIEPMQKMTVNNQASQYCTQHGVADSTRTVWRKGLTGSGQIIQDLDTGCRESSYFFEDTAHRHAYVNGTSEWYWDANHRKVIGQQPGAYYDEIAVGYAHGAMSKYTDIETGTVYHGTHTSGSICGKDTMGTNAWYNGMAKDARLLFIDGGGDSGSVFGTSDLNRVGSWGWDSLPAHLPGLRAYISSNSWGDSSAHGRYDGSAMEADQFMWSHKDFLFLFSDGNEQGSITPPNCGSPATNKDGIAVGALEGATVTGGGANTVASYSSRGRMADGRLNPTITTPGGDATQIRSANGSADATTRLMEGTSMACPIAAGTCALLRQYFVDGWYPTGAPVAADGFTPSAALMKAAMAISGDSTTGNHGAFCPDSSYGWGRVNLDTALYFNGDNVKLLVDDNRTGLVTGEYWKYDVNIPSGATNLKVALNWTDYPGAVMSSHTLVNDLDLDVYEPNGSTRYRGNKFSTAAPRRSVSTATTNDSIDVLEGAHIQSPTTGKWTITVTGKNIPKGPQPFALVVTYRTTTTATMGKVRLDHPVYGLPVSGGVGDTIVVDVDDVNLVAAACSVRVYTKLAEPKPETLACARIGTGLYRGKIALWMGNVVHGDNRLTASQQDSIFCLYTDVNPAYTDTARAVTDAVPCRITNVMAVDPTPPNATQKLIQFTTNENANQKVYYGTTTALGSTVQVDTPLVMSHKVLLTGLTSGTIYYYDVQAMDYHGNIVRDDNGGRHYQFGTSSSGGADVLVVVLNDYLQGVEFYHPEFLTQALNVGGWSYDWWSTKDQGTFTTTQLRKYKAVFFQVGQENYPNWTPAERETIKVYHDNGARFSMTGHDIGWANCAGASSHSASPYKNTTDSLFCEQYLHFHFLQDIGGAYASLRGMTGDPVSGAYTGGINYYPPRSGFAADSITASTYAGQIAGKDSAIWKGPGTRDSCAVRYESNANLGTAGVGVWGGTHTKVVTNCFEITQIDTTNKANTSNRVDILNKMFIWLIGHDHPKDTVRTPAANTTYTTSPIKIKWNSFVFGGSALDTTWVEYSNNGGSSWNLLSKATTYALTDSFSWDITALENGTQYQVRVRINDKNVFPSMSGSDTVGNFTIKKASNSDFTGPRVLPGSITFKTNPVSNVAPLDSIIVSAVISDSLTGLSNIATAKCSLRVGGTSYVYTMSGNYTAIQVPVMDTIASLGWTPGSYKVFVMGADNSAKALRWGQPDSSYITVSSGLGSLSVNMSMAQAQTAEDGILVIWQTASESNTYQWAVERGTSESGPFTAIASLAAAGNSSQPREYRYKDSAVNPGTRYYYQIIEVDQNGQRVAFGPVWATATGEKKPAMFALSAPQPNPFGNRLEIRYQLPATSNVSLVVYNISGQRVRTLCNGVQPAKYYTAVWDGKDESGTAMSNGVYFYKLKANAVQGGASFESIKRATMIK